MVDAAADLAAVVVSAVEAEAASVDLAAAVASASAAAALAALGRIHEFDLKPPRGLYIYSKRFRFIIRPQRGRTIEPNFFCYTHTIPPGFFAKSFIARIKGLSALGRDLSDPSFFIFRLSKFFN